jgi:Fur family ferric uptake transcriptional regulator/Fur family peroxide stress response transcriptional regulator
MDKAITTGETGDRLRAKGIKPSVIRIKVFQYLLENRIHPTVDTIYRALLKEIPTLSKTSIYNTLRALNSKGMIIEIMTPGGEIRYDGYPARHAHFMCLKCGVIKDVSLSCTSCLTPGTEGLKVTEEAIYLKGYCEKCFEKKKKEKPKTTRRRAHV